MMSVRKLGLLGLVLSLLLGSVTAAATDQVASTSVTLLCEAILKPTWKPQWREVDEQVVRMLDNTPAEEMSAITADIKQRFYDLQHKMGRTKDEAYQAELHEDAKRMLDLYKTLGKAKAAPMLGAAARISGRERIKRFLEEKVYSINESKVLKPEYARKDLRRDVAFVSALATTGTIFVAPYVNDAIGPVLTVMGYLLSLAVANVPTYGKYLAHIQRAEEVGKLNFIMKDLNGDGSYWGSKTAHIKRDFNGQSLDIFYQLDRDSEPVLDIVYTWPKTKMK